MCGWVGLAFLICLVAFMLAWGWASYPVWWDPTFRDKEAFRAFRRRVSAQRALLIGTGGATLVLLLALAFC